MEVTKSYLPTGRTSASWRNLPAPRLDSLLFRIAPTTPRVAESQSSSTSTSRLSQPRLAKGPQDKSLDYTSNMSASMPPGENF